MENFLSSKGNIQYVPESYVFPPDTRPGTAVIPTWDAIPIIDVRQLPGNRSELIDQIMKASQDFGIFQVINHGISDRLMQDVLNVGSGFFALPDEDMEPFANNSIDSCKLYTSLLYDKEKIHYWRNGLQHFCTPLEKNILTWPTKPSRYREILKNYALEVKELGSLILDIISEGLGLESEYFKKQGLSENVRIVINNYPPCPDPSVTLGLPPHHDVGLINLLIEDQACGLQAFIDGQWLAVNALPNAFLVNLGDTMQVISNGKLKSIKHRAVTIKGVSRISVATNMQPSYDSKLEPEKMLLNESNPPKYKPFLFIDLLISGGPDVLDGKPPLASFEL